MCDNKTFVFFWVFWKNVETDLESFTENKIFYIMNKEISWCCITCTGAEFILVCHCGI